MFKNQFRNAFFAAVVTAFTVSANALPATLKDTMKAMNSNLTTISNQLADPTLNQSSAVAADDFVALVEHAKTFMPHKVEQAPATEQTGKMQDYTKALDGAVVLGKELATVLRANDSVKAAEILVKLKETKMAGHKQFK